MVSAAFANATPATLRSRLDARALCAHTSRLHGVSVLTRPSRASSRAHAQWLMKIGIFFSTATSNTPDVADIIKAKFCDEADEPEEIGDIDAEQLLDYEMLVVGTPTWNTGADDQRSGTEWDEFLYNALPELDLSGKTVACFGLGDAAGYSEFFCDALEELHDCFEKAGCNMVGYVEPDYVDFVTSKSVRNGKFLGLALNYVNEDADDTKKVVEDWCDQVLAESKASVSC